MNRERIGQLTGGSRESCKTRLPVPCKSRVRSFFPEPGKTVSRIFNALIGIVVPSHYRTSKSNRNDPRAVSALRLYARVVLFEILVDGRS